MPLGTRQRENVLLIKKQTLPRLDHLVGIKHSLTQALIPVSCPTASSHYYRASIESQGRLIGSRG